MPALYRYFPSKDALVGELQRRVVAILDGKLALIDQRCSEWLALPASNPSESFEALAPIAATGLFYAGLVHTAPEVFGLLALSIGDPRHLIDDQHAQAVIESALPMFSRLASQIERAVACGALEPAVAVDRAVILWGALHGVAQLGKLTRLAPDLLQADRLSGSLLHTLLVGWGADPALSRDVIDRVADSQITDVVLSPEDLASVASPRAD